MFTPTPKAAGALAWRPGRRSFVGLYDEHELAGSYARHLRAAGVEVVLGAVLAEDSLLPGDNAHVCAMGFGAWLNQSEYWGANW